ncbi:hypothetical protein HIU98_15605 [Enterococcus casseliflavus]|nr:hypothetical protein [Enterococcus casseliflavus]
MAKRKLTMNAAEKERYDDHQTIRVVRGTIRKFQKDGKTVPSFLFDQLKELKYKLKFPGVYRRSLSQGKEPWL